MRSPGVLIGFICIIVIILAGSFFYNQTKEEVLVEMNSALPARTPVVSTSPLSSASASPSASPVVLKEIPVSWKTFQSETYGYSIRYPEDVKAEKTTEGDRFLKTGPTQSLGTELYDGIVFTIKTGNLENRSLEQLAKQRHGETAKEETTRSITELTPATFGTHQGYSFRRTGLGDGQFIYLLGKDGKYFEIINMTVEPTNRAQTFQNIVDLMIMSIRF